jgi:hypothetical protein
MKTASPLAFGFLGAIIIQHKFETGFLRDCLQILG